VAIRTSSAPACGRSPRGSPLGAGHAKGRALTREVLLGGTTQAGSPATIHVDRKTSLFTRLKVNSEVGGELFYNFGITPALHVTFDLQAVSSARTKQETALIHGGRMAVNF
jgi:hypothetical protein